ncbi:MAG TPA: pyridoxamine 5'-phosphate oxidase [Flavobacteriales bacterium]|nr:pyridoxamine 5'-phosphate oxidase [Flavobacteriales bacterium]
MGLHARTDYTKGVLTKEQLGDDPWKLFAQWLDDATSLDIQDPTAFALSTLDDQEFPHSRIVLLRDIRDGELVFFTNYASEKGQDLARHSKAGATFFWPQLERQVRIRGTVTQVAAVESDAYFSSRPRKSQLGAWASDQSTSTEGRDALDQQYAQREQEFEGGDVPRPPHWGGFAIKPVSIEFWQGRASRMHDRFRCDLNEGDWRMTRLQP